MPTLEWIGKEKVINHDKEVPFKMLDAQYTFDETGRRDGAAESGNLIIHGDNLLALKALLPKYQGKVKCIYIDPPYNTGNEGWVYNDKVSDPQIKKWLGEVVGKEGEDLSRHDKWLCMMYPRLKLLQQLLADDGIIFVSINDIEVSFLRILMDEIFGTSRFVAQLIWKSRQNKDNRNVTNVSIDHEYILCYGAKVNGCKRDVSGYSNPDNDPRGPWVSANMVGLATEIERPNLHYELINPANGINYGKPLKGWRYDRNTMKRLIEENRIIWPPRKSGRPRKKQYISELIDKVTGYPSIVGTDIYTSNGTKEQLLIFGNSVFAFPKPELLIEELIEQATNPDSIVLDSFAGSGTTAHAVLSLNQKDNGNRKFILVEMMDYADSITAERVKRVIRGYGEGDKATPGTGGSFTYYELGETLFDDEGNLNASIPEEKIREYVWYMETKLPLPVRTNVNDNAAFLGVCSHTAYYFHYDADSATTLDHDFLASVKTEAESYVIYADACALSEEFLSKHHITFKKIPRDIERL